MWSGDLPLALSKERRNTLPSMAMTPWQACENLPMNFWKQALNCSGSRRRNTREKVSWLGNPFSSFRNCRRETVSNLGVLTCLAFWAARRSGESNVVTFECSVHDSSANLEHQVRSSRRPAHLLFCRHPSMEQP